MFTKKKPSLAKLNAQKRFIEISERELSRLRDKIANDTITPDEVRYYDRIKRMQAESILEIFNEINGSLKTKRARLKFWTKVADKHF